MEEDLSRTFRTERGFGVAKGGEMFRKKTSLANHSIIADPNHFFAGKNWMEIQNSMSILCEEPWNKNWREGWVHERFNEVER